MKTFLSSTSLASALCTALVVLPVGSACAAPMADSTGGSSAARAGLLLAHAQARTDSADRLAAHHTFQPWADSTGGSSEARAGHDLSTGRAMDVAVAGVDPVNDAH
jgi:hypothetical protein